MLRKVSVWTKWFLIPCVTPPVKYIPPKGKILSAKFPASTANISVNLSTTFIHRGSLVVMPQEIMSFDSISSKFLVFSKTLSKSGYFSDRNLYRSGTAGPAPTLSTDNLFISVLALPFSIFLDSFIYVLANLTSSKSSSNLAVKSTWPPSDGHTS